MKTLAHKILGALALVSTLAVAAPSGAAPQSGVPPIPASLRALIPPPAPGPASDPVERKIVLEFRCNENPDGGYSTTVNLYINGALVGSGVAAGMCWNGSHTL
jgi:hypothetical protein